MSRAEHAPPPAPPVAIFAALGDGTRLWLLEQLSSGDARSIAALAGETRLTRQAVSKHLMVLEGAGLVGHLRVGRESRYAYKPGAVDAARDYLDQVAAQWSDALGRLQAFVERD